MSRDMLEFIFRYFHVPYDGYGETTNYNNDDNDNTDNNNDNVDNDADNADDDEEVCQWFWW